LNGFITLRCPLKDPDRVESEVVAWKKLKPGLKRKDTEVFGRISVRAVVTETRINLQADLPEYPGTTFREEKEPCRWGLHVHARGSRIKMFFMLPVFEREKVPVDVTSTVSETQLNAGPTGSTTM
jgi:hypothetical protein